MTADDERMAARANQRAAAFLLFSIRNDHESMHDILGALDDCNGGSLKERLAFVVALGSIASQLVRCTIGERAGQEYLETVVNASAMLAETGLPHRE